MKRWCEHLLVGVVALLCATASADSALPDFSIVVERGQPVGDGIPGTLFVNDNVIGTTLEHLSTAMPAGTYDGTVRYTDGKGLVQSEFGGQSTQGDFLVEIEIPHHPNVLFHGGVRPNQSTGCVLLGGVIRLGNGYGVVPDGTSLRRLRQLFYASDSPNATPAVVVRVTIRDSGLPPIDALPSLNDCDVIEHNGQREKTRLQQQALDAEDKLSHVRHDGAHLQGFDQQLQSIVDQIDKLRADTSERLQKLSDKVAQLAAERDQALEELKSGQFCSKCRRPASEIEREDHVSFAEHLGLVHGEAVPVTQEELDAKAAEYDDKIQELASQYDAEFTRAARRDSELRKSYGGVVARRDAKWRAFQNQILQLEHAADDAWSAAQRTGDSAHSQATACRQKEHV